MITRRDLLVAGVGLTAHSRLGSAPIAGVRGLADDTWYWASVARIEARIPDGGPMNGVINHSRYGTESHRAGGSDPNGAPTLSTFYVKALFAPGDGDGDGWDVGFVWRIDEEWDALWWTVDVDQQWSLSRGIWAVTPRDGDEIARGRLCDDNRLKTPVQVQALVVDSRLACSVNGGTVVNVKLPQSRVPGNVGTAVNLAAGNGDPDGFTAYRGLSVWSIGRDDAEAHPDLEEGTVEIGC